MNEILQSITHREIAAASWFTLLFLIGLTYPATRAALANIASLFVKPVIVLPLALAALYAAGEIYILSLIGWWSLANLKTTIIWVVTFAFVTMFELVSADVRAKGGFAKVTREILTVATLLTFITELYSFSLLTEIAVLPVVAVLGLLSEMAKYKPEHAKVAALLGAITALIGFVYFGFSVWMSIAEWRRAASLENALEFAIPVLLSIGFLPFLYFWRGYAAYDDIFSTLSVFGLKKRLIPYARWLAISRIGGDLELLERWHRAIQQSRPANRQELKHSLTALLALRAREASPPNVPPEHGWSPYLAMQFLSDLGFDTGHYHHSFDDEWFASTPMREIGDAFPMPNNLAYYIDGTEHSANAVKLKLNINAPATAQPAEEDFIIACMHLLEHAVSLDAAERMKRDIASLGDFQREIPYGRVTLSREDFTNGKGGYSRIFAVRRG